MLKFSMKIRNTRLNAIRDSIGASPLLRIFAQRERPLCSDRDPDGLLVEMRLPELWLGAASNGGIMKDGTWAGKARDVGIARSFRIVDASNRCHLQGSVSKFGSGGDLMLSQTSLVPGQNVEVLDFQIVSSPGATVLESDDLPIPEARNIVRDGERIKVRSPQTRREPMRRDEQDDDERVLGDRVLAPGRSLRVPMTMMDTPCATPSTKSFRGE